MAETIESFVAKLQNEGVEAGQQAAEQIRQEAEKAAQKTVQDAQAEAEKIISGAKAEASQIIERGKTELELASRDTVMRLRETLEGNLGNVLAGPVEETLSDTSFLKEIMHSIAMEYVKADIEAKGDVKIKVNPEIHKALANWAIKELRELSQSSKSCLDFKATLRQAGFEFNVSGATIEVTQESVVSTLRELVSPKLREVFDKGTGKA